MMKVAVFAVICVAITFANESVTLDDSTDLIQESATIDAGMKAHAKVGAKVANAAKTKAGSQVQARATVMIGTHELDAEEVSIAKSNLKKLTMKLGARHPVFLGETASIADFTSTSTDARYVKGGYAKLKKILAKVDEFHNELKVEKQTAANAREEQYATCEHEEASHGQMMADRTKAKKDLQVLQETRYSQVAELEEGIKKSLAEEKKLSETTAAITTQIDNDYKKYWEITEERHQVRNVLMQALWLVCTGFRTFRHSEYCTNIRQQPDFDEPADGQDTKAAMATGDAKTHYEKMVLQSTTFGQTMQPVWEQQKEADAASTNSLDGDVDMEKGFVNNKAPWGVDPAGAQEEAELGESNESEDMSNDEMSSRLNFLLESSSVPARISSPITAFIQALDSNDAAVQESLVAALVNMDTTEGQQQSNEDFTWYDQAIAARAQRHQLTSDAIAKKTQQTADKVSMEKIEDDMAASQKAEQAAEAAQDNSVADNEKAMETCNSMIVEKEALLEICNEELTNIQRLNSLLRFLVVGDKPKCAGAGFDCSNSEQGSCTWRTRGAGQSASGANDCETETGADISCDYSESGVSDESRNSAEFCACEYGFFGENDKTCKLKTCPGFGRIRYNKNQQHSLVFDNQQVKVTEGWDSTAKKMTSVGIRDTQHPVLAVCSGIRKEEHGTCNVNTGLCSGCYAGTTEALTPAFQSVNGVDTVPQNVRTSFPYSGAQGKCEEWFVPRTVVGSNVFWTRHTDPTMCSGKGTSVLNTRNPLPGEAVYNVGKCRCQIDRYGTACEKSKIQMGSNEYYPEESPVACSGRGIPVVNQYPAVCQCNSMSTGSKCEQIRCPGFDKAVFNNGIQKGAPEDPECGMGKGQCVTSGENAGRCECQGTNACGVPAADMKAGCPGACLYEDCANNCGGDDTDGGTGQVGTCDRFTGLCSCSPSAVFNGPECLIPSRGVAAGEQKIDEMVWTSSMDKWGWSTCSPGTLLIGMKTDMKQSKDALYNLDSGLCQQPWEAGSKISNALHTSRCYHENWWKKFDTRGGKFCRRNYFVAGLFRSHCNSLYCIEMAKCCQVKRSMWTDCKWTSTKGWNKEANGFQVAGNQGFVVGFFRGAEHTLAGITSVRQCTPIWYGQLFKMKTRFDN
jgi:hypothetical protein